MMFISDAVECCPTSIKYRVAKRRLGRVMHFEDLIRTCRLSPVRLIKCTGTSRFNFSGMGNDRQTYGSNVLHSRRHNGHVRVSFVWPWNNSWTNEELQRAWLASARAAKNSSGFPRTLPYN